MPDGASAAACGKVILLGEHAVVYGVPALAVGIERGVRVRASVLDAGPSVLAIPAWGVEARADDTERDLARALAALLAAVGHPTPVRLEMEVDLPPGGGLGCSAAMGVAVARALDSTASAAQIAERAMAWERVFHGNPSGVDAAVSASGGYVMFERGVGHEPVRAPGIVLAVGHSGVASSTKSMVESVARLRQRRTAVVDQAFEAIRALVRNARLALEAGDLQALGKLMDLNQMLLSGLFLSNPEIEQMCELARGAGALGAKLTGAGGGGCVVALVPDVQVAAKVTAAWRAGGFEGFTTRVLGASPVILRTPETSP